MLLLAEAVEAHSLKARILTPKDELIEQKVQIMKKQYPEKIDVLYIPEDLQTQVSILVVDRKSSLAVEIKDDSKDSSYEAMGLGVYSNRRATVSSYVSLFETLWRLSEMYKESQSQLLSAEDELANMKQYLNEVLKEVGSMRSKSN